LDERHFNEATEVFRRFVKASEDTAGFFKPSNETLDDVPPPVDCAIKFDRTIATVFIVFRRNDWLDAPLQQIFVNPVGPISFIAAQSDGPREWNPLAIMQTGVGSLQ
jgi:hypothetical protein